MGAYYQNKIRNYEVYTMADLRGIANLENVPYKIKIMNDIFGEVVYENEKEIIYIKHLLSKIDTLEHKKLCMRKSLEHLYETVEVLCKKLCITEFNLTTEEGRKELIQKLETLPKEPIKLSNETKPIDLSGRTEELFIVGRDKVISNINVVGDNNVALFKNVDCDITIHDLTLSMKANGINNVALIASGTEEKSNPTVTLHDVTIMGSVNGYQNVSELFINLNGDFVAHNVVCCVGVNEKRPVEIVINGEKIKDIKHYKTLQNKETEERPFERKRKNNESILFL